jgi:hypothetical protein
VSRFWGWVGWSVEVCRELCQGLGVGVSRVCRRLGVSRCWGVILFIFILFYLTLSLPMSQLCDT